MAGPFQPIIDPNHWSLKPDPHEKGSYYRRIEDINRALKALEADRIENEAIKFVVYYFGCEKLARGVIGMHFFHRAIDAYHHKRQLFLAELLVAKTAMKLSMDIDELTQIFAEPPRRSARFWRNKLGHDVGPSNVENVVSIAVTMIPTMAKFLACTNDVLAYQKAKFSHLL